MKKACILTFAKVSNRGANLQAYGLSKYLEDRGVECTFIVLKEKEFKSNIKGKIYEYVNNFLAGFFRRKMRLEYTSTYHNSDELKINIPKADIYIVGSDQIWNPKLTKSNALSFFFDFLPVGVKRVSYAASFGERTWNFKNLNTQIENCLRYFSAISVREEDSQNILEDYFEIEAPIVLDPSLLLTKQDLLNIIGLIRPKNEAFVYLLYDNQEITSIVESILNTVQVSSSQKQGYIKEKLFSLYGIKTWLTKIANASLVITNSFHCMAVSILLEKDFVAMPSYPGREGRLLSLLKKLNLQDRFVCNLEDVSPKGNILKEHINYKYVNELLDKERKKSSAFIQDNIIN